MSKAAVIGITSALALALVAALSVARSRGAEAEDLRQQLAALRKTTPPPHASAPVPAADAEKDELRARVRSLEDASRNAQEAAARALEAARTAPAPGSEKPANDAASLRGRILDPSLAPKDRLYALAQLRATAPAARDGDVVQSMLQLLEASTEASIRADICRQLKGVTQEPFKSALLVRVKSDPDPKVRGEAAESLGPMAQDPTVRQALEQAALSDPEEEVKSEARKALQPRRR